MLMRKFKSTERKMYEKNTNDFKMYFIVCLMYLIGIVLGTIYFRIIIKDVDVKNNIIENFNLIRETNNLMKMDILIQAILKNIKTVLIFWIIGVSAIGSPFLVLLCSYKGFSIAFTISTILVNLGFIKGNMYNFMNIFLYTFFSILGMIILTVSSLKVSINIFKNKKDVRLEIIRHSIVTLISIIFFMCSVLLETFNNIT